MTLVINPPVWVAIITAVTAVTFPASWQVPVYTVWETEARA